jgi:hypothetical protein
MKQLFLIAALACISTGLFAHANSGHTRNTKSASHPSAPADSTQQFLLIIRYKSNMAAPSPEAMKTMGQHWGQFISELAQTGKLVTGYRPDIGGKTISGNAKTATDAVYAADNEVVSSIFVIKAANLEEATAIAKKCPIYEMDGSVEIRPLINTTP